MPSVIVLAHAEGVAESGALLHLATVLSLLAVGGMYLHGVRRLRRRASGHRVLTRPQPIAFALGLGALGAALLPPLDTVAHQVLSAHMAQHLVLLVVVPPLLVLGAPGPVLAALLDERASWIGRVLRPDARIRRRMRGAKVVATASVVHLGVVWAWHLPALYEAALASTAVHLIEHATMLLSAVVVWGTAVSTGGPKRRAQAGGAVAMFVVATLSVGLGTLMTFAAHAWYPSHAVGALAMGMDPLADQQVAGALMWTVGGLAYPLAGALLFAAWLRDDAGRDPLVRASRHPSRAPTAQPSSEGTPTPDGGSHAQ